ncbi:MAG: hypothetical protein EU547_05910 [Promethearchaeota archaeon]|nr:MAG: hypothetical protein EU547_05910 [Candidatus Lokiarchaeota archaeon]
MKRKIGFDTTFKERGRIYDNYRIIRSELEKLGFYCDEYDRFPILMDNIMEYEMLIFACPDNAKFSFDELNTLENFVKNGRNLLVLSHAGGDKGRRTNLNNLTELFGIKFNNDQVLDKKYNLDLESFPLIDTYSDYYSYRKIDPICHRIGCSLEIINNSVLPLAVSSSNAIPNDAVTAALSEYGKGRVICVGSYEIFRDEVKGGISYQTNLEFFLFLMDLLNREELKSKDFEKDITRKDEKNNISNQVPNELGVKPVQVSNNYNEKLIANFNEFRNQVYESLKQQQAYLDKLNGDLNLLNMDIKKIKDLENKFDENYKKIHEKIMEHDVELLNRDSNNYYPSSNYDIIQDGLTEFKLEVDFINKKLQELDLEQKRVSKLLKESMQFNKKRNDFFEKNEDKDNVVFIKASDLVKNPANDGKPKSKISNQGNKNNDEEIEIDKVEIDENKIVKNNIDPKINQFKKFLRFLKKQYEIGVINEEEYIIKKKKIECKINKSV